LALNPHNGLQRGLETERNLLTTKVPSILFTRALDELMRLHGLVYDFVQAHSWADASWKSHPAIKPLFDYIEEEQSTHKAIEDAMAEVEEEESMGDKVVH
jgi:hypothetical protein